jgi:exopolyphosphatase / guanosine-5'-triphosphate,3'-diphosphate pyrophosphatase
MTAPRFAAIDIGSNSIKISVAEPKSSGWSVIFEAMEITRLGEGRALSPELLEKAIRRTIDALGRFASKAQELDVSALRVVATASLRGASNAQSFIDQAKEETGLDVELISGEREAALMYQIPASEFSKETELVVIDLGGRSTEIGVGRGRQLRSWISMDLGTVATTESFLQTDPPSMNELKLLRQYSREQIRLAPRPESTAQLVGVAGTFVCLAGLAQNRESIEDTLPTLDTYELDRRTVESLYERLRVLPKAQRIQGNILPPGRADVIVAGAAIVLEILDAYRQDAMRVTHKGVRYGILEELRSERLS